MDNEDRAANLAVLLSSFLALTQEKKQKKVKASGTPANFPSHGKDYQGRRPNFPAPGRGPSETPANFPSLGRDYQRRRPNFPAPGRGPSGKKANFLSLGRGPSGKKANFPSLGEDYQGRRRIIEQINTSTGL